MTQQILVRKIRRCVLVGGVVSLEMGFEISKAYLRLHLNLSMSYLKIRKSALQLPTEALCDLVLVTFLLL